MADPENLDLLNEGLMKEYLMDAIAKKCTSEEVVAFGLADGPLPMKIPLDPGVAAVGKALLRFFK